MDKEKNTYKEHFKFAKENLLGYSSQNGSGNEKPSIVSTASLVDFPEHMFSVEDDDSMAFLTESIERDGIQIPLIVRKTDDGHYEIVSGHRRKRAAELVGLKEVPVIITELSDEEAYDLMVSTNFHRLDLKPTERARMYQYAMNARNHRGKKTGTRSVDEVSKIFNASEATIKRYIALLNRSKEIQDKVDKKEMTLNEALSQTNASSNSNASPKSKAKKDTPNKIAKITFSMSEIEQYLPKSTNIKEAKSIIISLLEEYKRRNNPAK